MTVDQIIEMMKSPDIETKKMLGEYIKTCGSMTEDPTLLNVYYVLEKCVDITKHICPHFQGCNACPLLTVCSMTNCVEWET